jgi:aquaporin TIP
MSGGAEMIAGAIVQHVASKLGQTAWDRMGMLWSFKDDVQDMEDKMVTLQVALTCADKRSRGTDDALAQHWLKKYKSVAYDIEDALDELEANATIWKRSTSTSTVRSTVTVLDFHSSHVYIQSHLFSLSMKNIQSRNEYIVVKFHIILGE